MKEYDVIIVGGGVSGMTLASTINKKILIIEGNDRIGKKLLSTGNGKCNLINKNLDRSKYNDGLYNIFEECGYDEIESFYESLGLILRFDEEGRGYPYSESATTVLDAYRSAISKKDVDIVTSKYVEKIEKTNRGYKVITSDQEYYGTNVVVATGSDASFGKDSLSLFKGFGEVIEFKPSLAPLITKQDNIKGLNGIRVKCRVSLNIDGKQSGVEEGEVLFKTFGVSGIAIFNLSSIYARKSQKPAYISLNFMSAEYEDVLCLLKKRYEMGFDSADKILQGIFHKMIAQNILKVAQVTPDKILTNKNIESLAKAITDYRIEIEGVSDKSLAQVMHGGLKASEVNKNTLEVKGAKGMYAIGECVDMDGASGGYNIMWAVASALTVGKALK